jgi:hypothetical protein
MTILPSGPLIEYELSKFFASVNPLAKFFSVEETIAFIWSTLICGLGVAVAVGTIVSVAVGRISVAVADGGTSTVTVGVAVAGEQAVRRSMINKIKIEDRFVVSIFI